MTASRTCVWCDFVGRTPEERRNRGRIRRVIDPYALEVNDEEIHELQCETCEQERANDA